MIGEFFGCLVSVVTELFRPVVAAVESVVGVVAKCGSYVAGKVAEFIRELDPNCDGICESLEVASEFLNDVGDYLLEIGKDLDILGLKDCSNEELGAKILLPETRKREVDESAASYIEYLNTLELNRGEFENWDLEKKVASSVIGNALIVESIKEKTGVEIPVDFAVNMEKAEVKHEEVSTLIEEFNKEGKESMSEMNDFFENSPNMTVEKTEQMESLVTEALKELNPEMSEEEASSRITAIKSAVQSE